MDNSGDGKAGELAEGIEEADDLLDKLNDERRRVSGDGASSSSLSRKGDERVIKTITII